MLLIAGEEIQCLMLLGSAICHTHCHILLEVFLATNKVGNLRRDIICKDASIVMYPFAHLFGRALFSEVASNRNGEAFEWLFPHCGTGGLVTIPLLHC